MFCKVIATVCLVVYAGTNDRCTCELETDHLARRNATINIANTSYAADIDTTLEYK